MRLDELEVYGLAMSIGERVWDIVKEWDYFAKDTVGKQFVRAADSMAANISEGYGRFFFKENKQFGYYARGSLYETATWLAKGRRRGLVPDSAHAAIRKDLESLAIRLNNYIRSIGAKAQTLRESGAQYGEPLEYIELPPSADAADALPQ